MVENKKTERYFFIREVASITQLHPQTLRNYEKWGLVKPHRSQVTFGFIVWKMWSGLKIKVFTQDLGINLAGRSDF